MEEEIKIRRYVPADKLQLLEILQLNVPEYFAPHEAEDFDAYLDNDIEQYWVAEWCGVVIGSGGINFDKENNINKLSWDLVHPTYQGKGVGSRLLKYRLAFLHTTAQKELVWVRTSQMAYRFYEKNGFVLVETHKDYWAQGYDMYLMALR